jgi:hypothetical protein
VPPAATGKGVDIRHAPSLSPLGKGQSLKVLSIRKPLTLVLGVAEGVTKESPQLFSCQLAEQVDSLKNPYLRPADTASCQQLLPVLPLRR